MTDLAFAAAEAARLGARAGGLGVWLGQALHLAYQRDAAAVDGSFEAEVPVREDFAHRDLRVSLRGRADGVRADGTGLLVEELKSLAARREAWLPAYRLQTALYARMLGRERRVRVRAELVFLGSGSPQREPVVLSEDALGAAIARGLDALLAEHARRDALRARWRDLASGVRFPFPALRPGQAEIVASVEGALERGEQLLVEAGTGSGKTAAILTPALRAALASGRRLFVLTASTLQQHLALDTLARLAPGCVPLGVRLRAKRRMCLRDDLSCEGCDAAAGVGAEREPARLRERCFDAQGLALPDAVFTLGRSEGVCPHALQHDAAEESLVTVCDFNYAIDPVVALPVFRDPARLREAILVIDEVHQLPERARSALGVRLDGAAVRAAVESAALGGSVLHRELRDAFEALLSALDAEVADAGPLPDGAWVAHEPAYEPLAAIAAELRRLSFEVLTSAAGAPAGPAFEALFGLGSALERFLAAREPGFVSLAGRERGAPQLERFCVDPSHALGRVLGGCAALIGASATLSPPEWFAAELGLDPARSVHRRIAGADASHRRAVVIDAGVTTAEKSRARETPRLARRLAALCDAVPGNCLALLPSFAFLDAMRAALPPLARSVRVQARGDDEAERGAHVAALRSRDDVLLLAVAGGALAEGVDYAGARLSAVAVIGPCLPAVDAHRALLADHYAERFDRGFELAYAVPGMIRVVQSAGRLLRTETDRGVIALYDRRFLREPYASLLPEDWLAGGSAEDLRGDPASVARAFFA